MVGFVLPDSILEIFVGSITPSILPTSSTCEIPLDSRKFFILFPTSLRILDLSNLTYLTSQRKSLYLLIVMPYMAIKIKVMKVFKWFLFIPASVVAYFVSIFIMAFLWNLIPSNQENDVMNHYIMPVIINIIGIILFFIIGLSFFSNLNPPELRKVKITQSISIILIQVILLYLSFKYIEYNKIISSIIGGIVGVLALIETKKQEI